MSTPPLYGYDQATEAMAEQIFDYVLDRIRMAPPPLDGPRPATQVLPAADGMFTPVGLGHERAFALFRDVLAPACISSDHPRYLAFAPTAPSEAATLFDLVVSASSIYRDWWVEGEPPRDLASNEARAVRGMEFASTTRWKRSSGAPHRARPNCSTSTVSAQPLRLRAATGPLTVYGVAEPRWFRLGALVVLGTAMVG